MTLSSLRRLAGAALALALLAGSCAVQAQALHPLPPDFLATLKDIDGSADELAASVAAIKGADLTYSIFSRRRAEEAIARMQQQIPLLKTQTADLRREESLRVLLSVRTAFSDAQRTVTSVSDTLHGATVRTPAQAAELDRLLVNLDAANTRLEAVLKRFDGTAANLTARASATPVQGPATAATGTATVAARAAAPGTGTQAAASPPSSAPQANTPPLLPPDFLATLKDIDASADAMAASVTAVKNADLTYSLFSRSRVEKTIARMEQQLPALKKQAAELRNGGSLGLLLATRTAFSEAQRDIGTVSDILHGVTVRSQAQADALDRLLVRLDSAAASLGRALKRFDSEALAMMERLDRPMAKPASR
jgi:hypothetical protein